MVIKLTKTTPAVLSLFGALSLILAAICTVVGINLVSGLGVQDLINQFNGEYGSYSLPVFHDEQRPVFRRYFGLAFQMLSFVFGVVGGLLPMWSVGRLISDAIQSGDKS